jgi:hypothetical protein
LTSTFLSLGFFIFSIFFPRESSNMMDRGDKGGLKLVIEGGKGVVIKLGILFQETQSMREKLLSCSFLALLLSLLNATTPARCGCHLQRRTDMPRARRSKDRRRQRLKNLQVF